MDKKDFALGGLLVTMTVGAVVGAVKSVKGAITARKERIKAEKEFEETCRIANENLDNLRKISDDMKAQCEEFEALQKLKDQVEAKKREAAENGTDLLLNTRKLLDRAHRMLDEENGEEGSG